MAAVSTSSPANASSQLPNARFEVNRPEQLEYYWQADERNAERADIDGYYRDRGCSSGAVPALLRKQPLQSHCSGQWFDSQLVHQSNQRYNLSSRFAEFCGHTRSRRRMLSRCSGKFGSHYG